MENIYSTTSDYWIKPGALTISLNVLDNPQYLQSSVLSGAVIMAYKSGIIDYDSSHNYRKWNLKAENTLFHNIFAKYVYAQLDKEQDKSQALIVYSDAKLDITGKKEGSEEENSSFYYIYLGSISAASNNNGEKIPRVWDDIFKFGELTTDKSKKEETLGEWNKMFRLNKVHDYIEVLKDILSTNIQTLFLGKRKVKIVDVQQSDESKNKELINDNTIPTTKLLIDNFLSKSKPESTNFLLQLLGGAEVKNGLTADSITASELSKFLGGLFVEGGTDMDYLYVLETVSAKLVDAVRVSATNVEATENISGKNITATNLVKGNNVDATDTVSGKNILASETVAGENVEAADTVKGNHIEAKETIKGKNAVISGNTTTLNLLVQQLAEMYDLNVSHVATLFRTIVKDYISSETFIPGFTGEGMKLYQALNGDWNFEVDNLVVRKMMTVFELVISKIRAVNGGLVISPANGKVKSVSLSTGTPAYYVLTIEGDMMFVANDLVRCQVFTGTCIRYYWVPVASVNKETILILKSDFPAGVIPAEGDDLVQMGNTINKARQGLLYLTAAEDGKPRISVLDGVNSTSLVGKNKVILGCLDGMTDMDFPADFQPCGYGLYAMNVFLKGIFILRNGKSIESELTTTNAAAKAAKDIADAAKSLAASANTLLADIASDNKLTALEKQATKKEWDQIVSEKVKNDTSATKYGITRTAYNTAYSALSTYLSPLLDNLAVTSDIVGSTFRSTFKAYYDARTDLLTAISAKAKDLADAAQAKANKAEADAGNAQKAASDAAVAAGAAQTIANNAVSGANGANALLADIANDNKLTAQEKQSTKKEWDIIVSEKAKNDASADKYSLSKVAYAAAYTALSTYISPLLVNLSDTSDITGTTFRSTFKSYYDSRTDLLNAISAKSKDLADAAQGKANSAASAAADAQRDAIAANTAAGAAQTTANNAATSANRANSLLTDIASDNKLTATEKQQTKKEWDVIVSEKPLHNASAVKFGVSTSTYDTAYNALNTYVTPLLASLSVTSDIVGTTFRSTFKTYYEARTNLLNAISAAAKTLADAAQTKANSAAAAAGTAQTKANEAATAAGAAQTTANNAVAGANGANALLADIANDNKFTPSEKQSTKKEWDAIVSEKPLNDASADKFAVAKTTYGAAYTALSTYITPLLASLTTTQDIVGVTFRSTFKTYYDARTNLLNAISAKAKSLADAAQQKANAAQKAADDLGTQLTTIETKFEIREGEISAKVTEVTTKATQAATSATNAKTSETNASGAAATAGQKATAAGGSATAAAGSAANAKKAADDAAVVLKDVTLKESSITQTAGQIATKVTEVNTKVTEANTSATNAKKSETAAGGSAATAGAKAGEAATSATNAKSAADSAAAKLTTIIEKESSITQTAGQITTKVTEVTKKATEAATSAANAKSSETNAGVKSADAKKSADDAAAKLITITQKESSINQTAGSITLQVTDVTTKAGKAAASAAAAASSESAAENAAGLAMAMSKGKMLHRDPTFESGLNGLSVYNNLSNGVVTITRIAAIAGCPNASGYCVRVASTAVSNPGFGGFYFGTTTRANAVFVVRLIANIPVGRTLAWASNSIGTGGASRWLTPVEGTGKWEEYAFKVVCGSTGTFSSTNFFHLLGGTTPTVAAPLTWHLAYATVFDTTDAEIDYIADAAGKYTTKTEHSSSITQLSDKIELKVAKTDFNALGNRVSSAETTITQHTGQIGLKAERTDVSALGTRMASAEQKITPDAIRLTVKSQTDTIAANAASNAVSGLQIGGANLCTNTGFYNELVNWHWWSSTGSASRLIINEPKSLSGKALQCTWTTAGASGPYFSKLSDLPSKLMNGSRYTVSCWIKSSVTGSINLSFEGASGSLSISAVANTWTLFSYSFTYSGSSGSAVHMYYDGSVPVGTMMAIHSLKVEAGNKATGWSPAPEDVTASVKDASDAAAAAQKTADNVKLTADAAKLRLDNWSSDGSISPTEKLTLKQERKSLADEKAQVIADALKYAVSSTAYVTSFTNYDGELAYHTAITPENIAIRANFAIYQTAYYSAKQTILNAIAAATRKYAEDKADAAKNAAINDAAAKYPTKTEHSSDITQLSSKIELKVAKTDFDALNRRVGSAETTITQHSGQISLKASQSEVNALGTRMSNAEAKITPDAIKLTVKSQTDAIAAAAALRSTVLIDATALDASKYYPVTVQMSVSTPYTITLQRILDASWGKPSWSTHGGGFSTLCRWTSNGNGWGAISINRIIHSFSYAFSTVVPAGSIGQMSQSSNEYIYVRGGSKYTFIVEGTSAAIVTLRSSAYTINEQTIGVLTSVTTPIPDIKVAENAAADAQTTANNAVADANSANALLADIANDNKFTPSEKQSTKKEWDGIVSEKAKNDASADKFGVSKASYGTAYATLSAYITPLLASLTTTSAIVGSDFRAKFKAYYDARTDLLNAVSSSAKTLADNAQAKANAAQSNLDNLQIGGRNLYKKTTPILGLSNAPTVQREADADSVNGFQFTGKSNLICAVRLSRLITSNGEYVISFWGKSNATSTLNFNMCDIACTGNAQFTTAWRKFELKVKVTNYSADVYHFLDIENMGNLHYWFKDFKVEEGDKATGWSPAPEDVDAKITSIEASFEIREGQISSKVTQVTTSAANAKLSENNAAGSASTATSKATAAGGSATAAAGSASTAGTKAGEAAASASSAKKSADDAAEKLITITQKETSINQTESRISLKATEVTTKATEAATSATTAGQKATAAASSATAAGTKANEAATSAGTAGTKANAAAGSATSAAASASAAAVSLNSVTTKQSEINVKADQITLQVSTVTTKTSEAINAAELAMAMSKGKMLYRDPTFESGVNSTSSYALVGTRVVESIAGCPNRLVKGMRIIATSWPSAIDLRVGGFSFSNLSRANAVFVTRIIALIPVGRTIQNYHNAYGTGGISKWLTSQAGTGKWEEYACKVECGSSGAFSTINHFALTGGVAPTAAAPVTWYVAYATVFDTTDVDDVPTVDEVKAGLTITSGKLSLFGKDISLSGMITYTSLASDAQGKITTAQSTADAAKANATKAQGTANDAATAAGTANTLLADIASDSKLTASEKQQAKKEWDAIVSEKAKNDASAAKFGVSTAGCTTAYNALNTYITPLLASLTTTSSIVGSTFRSTFKAYYDARTDLLAAISAKAKDLADAAQAKANKAEIDAGNALTNSRNNIAVKLGYASYADMEAKAVAGKTLINGGLINTVLLAANCITADKIATGAITADKIAAGTITADKIKVDDLVVTKLKGATGSFKKLSCIDSLGKEVGAIEFGESGRMWFSGDMYHQGYNYTEKRSYRFYTSDLWCRGQFGHIQMTNMTYDSNSGNDVFFHIYRSGVDSEYHKYAKEGQPIDCIVLAGNANYVAYVCDSFSYKLLVIVNASGVTKRVKLNQEGAVADIPAWRMRTVVTGNSYSQGLFYVNDIIIDY